MNPEDLFNNEPLPDIEFEYPLTANDKYRYIPCCCGTPLQNGKCRVCGSNYQED